MPNMHAILIFLVVSGIIYPQTIYALSITSFVSGTGMLVQSPPYGNPTLTISSILRGNNTFGCFDIFYPADVTYNTSTFVSGIVSCLEVICPDAYVTGLTEVSYGPRSGNYPVGYYMAMDIEPNAINFSPAIYNTPCAPHQSGTGPLSAGRYVIYP